MATTSQYDPGEGFGGGGANRATDHQSLRQCDLDQVLRVVTFSLFRRIGDVSSPHSLWAGLPFG